MNKSFILDTNVLLEDSQSMFKFDTNTVHIPMCVIEELDNFKKDTGDLGFHARQVARYLDKLCKRGALHTGVTLNNGGTLIVCNGKSKAEKVDDQIVAYAQEYSGIIVSKDINVRLKARALGLLAEDHNPSELRNTSKNEYLGHSELELDELESQTLVQQRRVTLQREVNLFSNEYLVLNTTLGSKLGRYIKETNSIVLINEYTEGIAGVKGRNKEQRFVLDALMNPDLKLVTLTGPAGTGKTLCAIACALKQVLDSEVGYTKIVVARPIVPMGNDIGFLPGDINEKLIPWSQPIYDNIEYILETHHSVLGDKHSVDKLVEEGILRLEALAFIRGRSMPQQFIIIDESQNLTPHEVKTILTRAGEGTKIVLTGDTQQIDATKLDYHSNGLTYTINKFKDQKIAAHITLTRCERSELAEIASKLM